MPKVSSLSMKGWRWTQFLNVVLQNTMLLPGQMDHDDDATNDEADSAESDDAAPRQQSAHMRCISNPVWTFVSFQFF